MIDIESIRKRHEAAVNLARDLQRATLHGPVPIATTMQMASELVWASGEIVRLAEALKESARLLKNAEWMLGVVTAERDEALADMEEGQGVIDGVVNAFGDRPRESGLWPVGVSLGEAVAGVIGALATAKDEERAAVVAWLRGEAHFTDVGPLDTFADAYADGIESNRHREKA